MVFFDFLTSLDYFLFHRYKFILFNNLLTVDVKKLSAKLNRIHLSFQNAIILFDFLK